VCAIASTVAIAAVCVGGYVWVGVCVGGCHCHWTASLKKVGVGVCFKGLRNPHKRKPDIRYRYQHHDHDQDQDQDLMFMLLLNLYFKVPAPHGTD
jgi:hypothetical protein